MAPLPSNTTARVCLTYTSGGEGHVMELRPFGLSTAAAINAFAQDFSDAMLASMASGDAFTGGYYYSAGLNYSAPLSYTPGSGSLSPVTPTDKSKSAFLSVVGRSNVGRRARVTLFTQAAENLSDTRQPIGVAASWIVNLFTQVTTFATPLTAVDGSDSVVWKSYVNNGWNSYWQRELR